MSPSDRCHPLGQIDPETNFPSPLGEDFIPFPAVAEYQLYLTPLPNEKISCYIPSTPKKLKINKKEDDSYVKGKNLLYIFESM